MGSTTSVAPSPAQRWLISGQRALKAGKRAEALLDLRQAVAADPDHVESLLWLAGFCDDPRESLSLFARVLTLERQNQAAREGIRWARRSIVQPESVETLQTPRAAPHEHHQRAAGTAASTTASQGSRQDSIWSHAPSGPTTVSEPVPSLRSGHAQSAAAGKAPSVLAPGLAVPPSWGAAQALAKEPVLSLAKDFVRDGIQYATGLSHRALAALLRLARSLKASAISFLTRTISLLGIVVLLGLSSPVALALQPYTATPAALAETAPASAVPGPPAGRGREPQVIAADYPERAERLLREAEALWAHEDWERVIPLLAQAAAFRPGEAEINGRLKAAYFSLAVSLLEQGEPEKALRAFDRALEVAPGDPEVMAERSALTHYLAGLRQFGERDWPAAVQSLSQVYAAYAGYLDTRGLLYRAHYYRGLERKQKNDLAGALAAFQAAIEIDAEAVEARGELARVKAALAPPAPLGAAGEKWIEINLATQRLRAYQGQKVLYEFVVSTGEPGRATQPGRYRVLDKIPNAYSRFWNLKMPYWLGIYWAGTSENGIHALPTLSDGRTLWSGFLGRRVSFGCVILDTQAARLLYQWAEVGTPVHIHS